MVGMWDGWWRGDVRGKSCDRYVVRQNMLEGCRLYGVGVWRCGGSPSSVEPINIRYYDGVIYKHDATTRKFYLILI